MTKYINLTWFKVNQFEAEKLHYVNIGVNNTLDNPLLQ